MVRIPEHSELEIDSVISRQNVAKEGWTTYYVDGENGNDANNGLRWETAFKTIQHAVGVAESWAKIYVKSGTYQEHIGIYRNSIHLIGEDQATTFIVAGDHHAIYVHGSNCRISGFNLTADAPHIAVLASGNYIKLELLTTSRPVALEGNYNIATNLLLNHDLLITGNHNVVTHCVSENVGYGIRIKDSLNGSSQYNRIIENDVIGATYGVAITKAAVESQYNTIAHNNLMDCTHYALDEGTNNVFFENYYSAHSNIDNGFGIATEPYVFTGGSDPRPVVCRNGWLGLGLGGNTIKSVPASGTYTHSNDTNEHDVLEFTAATQDIHISLDVSALTQPVEIREYEKIDSTNYRQISLKTYPDDFDTGTDAITIYFKQKNKDYKVTLKSTVAEGASRDIPYVYRTDGKV